MMKYILYLIVLLYALLPFQFALSPFENIDLAIVRVFILILTVLFFAISLLKRNFFIPCGWIATFFTLFFMWLFFSLFFSPVFSWTLRKILFFISIFPLFYILTAVFVKRKNSLQMIAQATIIGSIAISLVGIFQFFIQFFIPLNTLLYFWSRLTPLFLGKTFSESIIAHNSWLVHVGSQDLMRSIAFFPDPHVFSFYLGITLPLALGLFFTTKKSLWLYGFFIILIADLLTFSRGAYIGLFCGFVICIILLWPRITTRMRHIFTLSIISIFFLLIIPQNPIMQRFMSSFVYSDTSSTHRIELWTQAIEEVSKRPLIGTGLGAYSYTVNPRANYRTPIYVHNLILDITVELGIVGLFFFIGIFASAFFILYKNRSNYISLFAIISLCIFFFHSMFDTALFSVHIVPLLILIFAIGSHYENIQKK